MMTDLRIEITLERNTGPDRLTMPYFAHIHCPDVINRDPDFIVPVRAAYIGMKKTFSVETAGFRMITERMAAIPTNVEKLLKGIVRGGRVPHYVFIARDAGTVYPVYTIDDVVVAPTPNGPLFEHVELAKVRERLTDYLHSIRVLGKNGRNDKLHVRGVHRRTLQLVRPKFYLKKRVPGETDFWAPVFASIDSPRIYAYAASDRREANLNDGREVLVLRDLVAKLLKREHRLNNTYDLRPDRLFPDTWEALSEHLERCEHDLDVNGFPLPTYTTEGGVYIALEQRLDEERYSLYMGVDRDDVTEQATRDFLRRGIGL